MKENIFTKCVCIWSTHPKSNMIGKKKIKKHSHMRKLYPLSFNGVKGVSEELGNEDYENKEDKKKQLTLNLKRVRL